ncbi:MAG: site-2 protease family protein, partial [Bacteroidota bacterium]
QLYCTINTMENNTPTPIYDPQPVIDRRGKKNILSYFIHIILFFLSFITTTVAGVLWVNKNPLELTNFHFGLPYSLSLLTMLSAHEFGHYFAAKFHGIQTTLPYFIPFPPFIVLPFASGGEFIQLNPFGTMGAVIRIRSPLSTKTALFDIGIAGPLAGLVVTIVLLLYGIATLPSIDYLYQIHPEYRLLAQIPENGLTFGNSIFFWILRKSMGHSTFFPPMNEIYHYPYLCVGWFGLFITAINLIPAGQLDGGHIVYALMGNAHRFVARGMFVFLILFGLTSFLPILGFKVQPGTAGWLVWAAILFFVIKLDHPPVYDDTPLSSRRNFWGWLTMLIFIFIFPPVPIFEIAAH